MWKGTIQVECMKKIWEWGKDENGVGEKGMKTNVEA
jgi:hypothetical protein